MSCTRPGTRGWSGSGQRGSILIVVLILTVTFACLSVALLSTAEMSIRVRSNGQDIERAERAAQSGVEWAAALVKRNGLVDADRTVTLAPGVEVQVAVRAATTPNLSGRATVNGVAAAYAADVALEAGTYPHALVVFDGTSTLNHTLSIQGDAYFGHAKPLAFKGSTSLLMAGNLELATSTVLASGHVVHSSGSTSYSVPSLSAPVWDTTLFTLPLGWTVPVATHLGSTTLRRTTLSGIVIVNLLGGQRLVLEDLTINGTLVVPSVYPPILELLGAPRIELKGAVTINGGTADTGNLAVLAPSCRFDASAADSGSVIHGVGYFKSVEKWSNLVFRGQLLLREGIEQTSGAMTIERPPAFVPTVPRGINWNGATSVRIAWRGRQ